MSYQNPPIRRVYLGEEPKEIVENTVSHMKSEIVKASIDPFVRWKTEQIIQNISNRDQWGEVQSIWNFIRNNTRYAYDPRGTEFIQTPNYVLRRIEMGDIPSLDCDDMSVLSLSMLKSIGYPVAIRIASYNLNKRPTHVYGLVKINGKWVVFDAVRKDVDLGWEAPNPTYIKDYRV